MNLLTVLVILVLGVTGAGCFLGYRLRKSLKTIKRLETSNKKLTRMNTLLTSGASVHLTSYEKNLIKMALDYTPFRDMMRLPQTRKFIRDTWRGLKIKIKESIKE